MEKCPYVFDPKNPRRVLNHIANGKVLDVERSNNWYYAAAFVYGFSVWSY